MNFFDGLMESMKEVAPSVVGFAANTLLPGSGGFVNSLMKKVAGTGEATTPEEDAAIIQADPEKYLEFKKSMIEQETRFRELDSQDLQTVNKTMQVESGSDKWWVSGWRPFNGYLYGITIFMVYFILPLFKISIPEVPVHVWIGWGAILGITTYDRGKEKRVKAGDQTVGMVSNLVTNLIKR